MLETERLVLRRFEPGDIDTLARWNADPVFMKHMGRGPMSREESVAMSERHEAHWREHGFGLLAVTDRASGALIGRCGPQFHRAWPDDPEVGWAFDPEWWGRGLATEAGRVCVGWAFGDLGYARLVSITMEDNRASRRVMEKLGFELRERIPFAELGIELLVHALDRRPRR